MATNIWRIVTWSTWAFIHCQLQDGCRASYTDLVFPPIRQRRLGSWRGCRECWKTWNSPSQNGDSHFISNPKISVGHIAAWETMHQTPHTVGHTAAWETMHQTPHTRPSFPSDVPLSVLTADPGRCLVVPRLLLDHHETSLWPH